MALRKRKGQEAGDQAVLVIESVKAVLRLALLGTTGGRGGVQPAIAEREVDPTLLDLHRPVVGSTSPVVPRVLSTEGPPPRSAADVLLGPIRGSPLMEEGGTVGDVEEEMSHRDYWKGPRTGLTRPTIASIRGNADPMIGDATVSSNGGKESVQQYLLTRVLTVEDVRRDQDLVNKTMGFKKLAEVIWIMRPLLYGLSYPVSIRIGDGTDNLTGYSPRDAQVRQEDDSPFPPVPLSRVPLLLPPRIDLLPPLLESLRSDAPSQFSRTSRICQASESVLVVPCSRTRVGELDETEVGRIVEYVRRETFDWIREYSHQGLRPSLGWVLLLFVPLPSSSPTVY